jgi:hypothetical protein
MAYAEALEAVVGKFPIIAQVSEEFAGRAFVARKAFREIALIDQIMSFAIERSVITPRMPPPSRARSFRGLV